MGWIIFRICVALLFTLLMNNEQHNKKQIPNSPQYWFNSNDSITWQISKKRTMM